MDRYITHRESMDRYITHSYFLFIREEVTRRMQGIPRGRRAQEECYGDEVNNFHFADDSSLVKEETRNIGYWLLMGSMNIKLKDNTAMSKDRLEV